MKPTAYPAHIRKDGTIQTVAQHCRESAEIARTYLSKINLGESAYLAGLLHDSGKCTEEFRKYITAASSGEPIRRGSVIHTFAGLQYLITHFHHKYDEYSDIASEILSIAISSHHGLIDCFDVNSICGFTHRLQKQPEYDKFALTNFFSEVAEEEELQSFFSASRDEFCALLKIIINNAVSEEDCLFYTSLLTRLITSAIVDADRNNTRDFETHRPTPPPEVSIQAVWSDCLNAYNRYISTFPVETPIQKSRQFFSQKCLEASKGDCGLYRLNLPTGGGKTLSGLRFALNHAKVNKKSRIFFLSPLLSILEQNACEIRKAIGNDAYVLEHHSDVVTEWQTAEQLENYELLCESWNAPIVITTLVQFLNTLFSGKMSSVRRFHSLADSVIIIDEVQTVPLKMLSLFNTAINFLTLICKTTVVLCSATQPNFDALSHPIICGKDIVCPDELKIHQPIFKRNRIENQGKRPLSEIPGLIAELLKKSSSVLVICNKKSEAEALFLSASSLCENRYHLSAGMCIAHRKAVLEAIKKDLQDKKEVLCISTQVIEAGVDISFGAVLRFSAGLDNIVQAAGRCNRNGEHQGEAPVWIVECEDEKLSLLKDIKDAKDATESLLYSYQTNSEQFDSDLASDSAIDFYYKKLYRHKASGFFDYNIPQNRTTVYSLLSDNCTFVQNAPEQEQTKYTMRQAFRTAGEAFEVFDEDQKNIIVPYLEGAAIIGKLCAEGNFISSETINKAKPYTVSVFSYQFNELLKQGAIHAICGKEIYVLDPSFYDESVGVISVKKGDAVCDTLIL